MSNGQFDVIARWRCNKRVHKRTGSAALLLYPVYIPAIGNVRVGTIGGEVGSKAVNAYCESSIRRKIGQGRLYGAKHGRINF